jgi:hypothetical protein
LYKEVKNRIGIGYIKILWNQQSLQGVNPKISEKYRLPRVAVVEIKRSI